MNDEVAKPGKKRKLDPPKRNARGFVHAASMTRGALKAAGQKRGFAEARLLTEWRAVVGEALAGICRPLKVSYARSGPGLGATLILATDGARAPEVEMRRPVIIERVNAFYGYRAIARVSIDQRRGGPAAARPGFAEDQADFAAPPPQSAPIPGVNDQRLALALGRLGANIKAKSAGPSAAPQTRRRP